MPGYHHGRPPRNKGMRYPADPPTIEEIVAVMRVAGERANGIPLRHASGAAAATETCSHASPRICSTNLPPLASRSMEARAVKELGRSGVWVLRRR
jgi:hypothetical protein